MPFRDDPPLLGNLPLEPVKLRTIGGEGRITLAHVGGEEVQRAAFAFAKHRINSDSEAAPLKRLAEERSGMSPATDESQHRPLEFIKRQMRHLGKSRCQAVAEHEGSYWSIPKRASRHIHIRESRATHGTILHPSVGRIWSSWPLSIVTDAIGCRAKVFAPGELASPERKVGKPAAEYPT